MSGIRGACVLDHSLPIRLYVILCLRYIKLGKDFS